MTRKSMHTLAVAAIQPPRSKPVTLTEQAQEATHLAQLEAERLQHRYLGPSTSCSPFSAKTAPPPACYAPTASTWNTPAPTRTG